MGWEAFGRGSVSGKDTLGNRPHTARVVLVEDKGMERMGELSGKERCLSREESG